MRKIVLELEVLAVDKVLQATLVSKTIPCCRKAKATLEQLLVKVAHHCLLVWDPGLVCMALHLLMVIQL